MKKDWTYELHVIGTRPRDLPLDDFGELAKRFADLLGARQHIRFESLKTGSADLRARVLEPGLNAVIVNVAHARDNHGSAAGKVAKIDDYLAAKGWHGELRNRQGRVLLVFPGATIDEAAEVTRTVQQMDSIIGKVIKIGGRDDTVPMQLEVDGRYLDLTVRGRELACKLGALLFQEVRVFGLATWNCDAKGVWDCATMIVDEFDRPSSTSLEEMFEQLGSLPGNEWNSMDDPEGEWLKLRRGDQ